MEIRNLLKKDLMILDLKANNKSDAIEEIASKFYKKGKEGLDYEALDVEDTFIFFAIAAPDGENNLHVETLAQLSNMIMKCGFVDDLKTVNNSDEVYSIIDKYSDNKDKQVIEKNM